MNTICENSDDEAGGKSSLVNLEKLSTLEKNDQKWNAIRDDVYHIYIEEKSTLKVTMGRIYELFSFQASPRKWKDKLKEWGFDKKIPAGAMQFIVHKAEKRAKEGKDTEFSYSGTTITTDRVENFKRRKTASVETSADTPPNIQYHTPPAHNNITSPGLIASEAPYSDLQELSDVVDEVSGDISSLKVLDDTSILLDSFELSKAAKLRAWAILQPHIAALKKLGRDECPGSLLFGKAAILDASKKLDYAHRQTCRSTDQTSQDPGLSLDSVQYTKQKAAIGVKSGDECHFESGFMNGMFNCSTECIGLWSSQEAIELIARWYVALRLQRHDIDIRLIHPICTIFPDLNVSLIPGDFLDIKAKLSMKKRLCGFCRVEVWGDGKRRNESLLHCKLGKIFNCSKAFEAIQDHETAQKYFHHLIQVTEMDEVNDFYSLSEERGVALLRIESKAALGAICARRRHFEEATNLFFEALRTYIVEPELTQQDVLDSFPQIDSRITEVYSQLELHQGRYWIPLEASVLHLRQINTVSHIRHNLTVQMSLGLKIAHAYYRLGDPQSAIETCRKTFYSLLTADYIRDTSMARALLNMGLNVGQECLTRGFSNSAWHVYEQLLPKFLKGNCEYNDPESEALLSNFIDLADQFSLDGFRDVAEYIYMALAPVLIESEDISVILEIADIFTSDHFLISAEHLLRELLDYIHYSKRYWDWNVRQKLSVVLRKKNKANESAEELIQSYCEAKEIALIEETQLRKTFEKDILATISLFIAEAAALDAMVAANEGPETIDELVNWLSQILKGFAIEEQIQIIDISHGKSTGPINPSSQRSSERRSGRGDSSVITQLTSSLNARTVSTVESHPFGKTYSVDSTTAWFS